MDLIISFRLTTKDFLTNEVSTKIYHRLHLSVDGSLRFFESDVDSSGLHLPIAMTLTLVDSSFSSSSSSSSSSPSSSLVIQHVQRTKLTFYELRVFRSTIEILNQNNNNDYLHVISKAIQDGIATAGKQRPRSILTLINPNSGWGKGIQNFLKTVKPVFDTVGVKSKMVPTKSVDHIQQIIDEEELTDYDGVIVGGGDGTLSHVLHAIARKTLRQAGKEDEVNKENPRLVKFPCAIGVLPVGSGNTTAIAMNMSLDLTSIACNIVLGHRHPINITSIHDIEQGYKMLGVAHTMGGYAMVFDLIQKLEKRRFFGPLRYFAVFFQAVTLMRVKRAAVKWKKSVNFVDDHVGRDNPDGVDNHDVRDNPDDVDDRDGGDTMSDEEKDERLKSRDPACVSTEDNGVIIPCSECLKESEDSFQDDDDDEGEPKLWHDLPEGFLGEKELMIARNARPTSLLDIKDYLWVDCHLGNGVGSVLSQDYFGKTEYLKIMLGFWDDFGTKSGPACFLEPILRQRNFSELIIELDPLFSSSILSVDGEIPNGGFKTYFKVHKGIVSFFGTGIVRGHQTPLGQVSRKKLRVLFVIVCLFVISIVVLLFYGLGRLLSYIFE